MLLQLRVDGQVQALSNSSEDAMDVVRVLPLAACCVVFWCGYAQMSNNFVLQVAQMELSQTGQHFTQ